MTRGGYVPEHADEGSRNPGAGQAVGGHRYCLEEINQGYADLGEGKLIRGVIILSASQAGLPEDVDGAGYHQGGGHQGHH